MDEKHHPANSPQSRSKWHYSYSDTDRKLSLRRICIAVCLLMGAWAFRFTSLPHLLYLNDHGPQRSDGNEVSQNSNGNSTRKVSLEAHIMSKCPDAKACLRELVIPAMEKVHEKVDFELSFIGSVDPHSDAVSCKHGPSECLGNMILLCAADLYPDPKLSLGFANCMINDYHHIPRRELVESCAMEHALDFQKINGCISDEGKGQGLLRDSVERSAAAKIRTSCTIRLQGKIWCVTDGKKDCNDGANLDGLIKGINSTFNHSMNTTTADMSY